MPDSASTPNDERGSGDLTGRDRIDDICDGFERAWRAGQNPNLLDFVAKAPSQESAALFIELLMVEIELRGETPRGDWSEYFERYPDYADQIELARFRHTAAAAKPTSSNGQTPKRLGRFELIEKIGAGGAGEVWRARDLRLNRVVAIKMPRLANLSDDDIARFAREGRTAARLSHPGIVPVHEVCNEEGTALLVSEFIDGPNLRDWLANETPSVKQAAEICRQIAEALEHAHARGVVHRDLKPSNVLLDETQRAYLTDFGLAKWYQDADHMTLDGQVLGTPAYMAPEQARGESDRVGPKSDIHAVGVILYEMLTRKRPFDGDSVKMAYKIVHDEPPPPRSVNRSIPRDLETICLKAMEKEPDNRYATAQELADDLGRFLNFEGIHARRATLVERGWRMVRRRRLLTASILLGLAAVGSLLLASRLASENHALLGLRNVEIDTEPHGARVAFVPLDDATGLPLGDKVFLASGVTPVQMELASGDYLVEAVLPDGRFHQVYRRVPKKGDVALGGQRHVYWVNRENGLISLNEIVIPPLATEKGMAYIALAKKTTAEKAITGRTAGFFIDCHEFTQGDRANLPFPITVRRQKQDSPELALNVDYNTALTIAERMGKRLPTESEYELAVASCRAAPPESGWPSETSDNRHAAGVPETDATDTNPPILGLRSNVAEWTVSRDARIPVAKKGLPVGMPDDERIVRGPASGLPGSKLAGENRKINGDRAAVSRYTVNDGLGFRCVRSETPQYIDVSPRRGK